MLRAISSVGRASRLHREGRQFEPVIAYHLTLPKGGVFFVMDFLINKEDFIDLKTEGKLILQVSAEIEEGRAYEFKAVLPQIKKALLGKPL